MTPGSTVDPLGIATGGQLRLTIHGTEPPIENYINQNAQLFVNVWSASAGATIVVNVKMLLPAGTIQVMSFSVVPSSDRTRNTVRFPLTEGFLLSVICGQSIAGAANRVFVGCQLAYGSTLGALKTRVLFQGYLLGQNVLSFPPGRDESSLDGMGAMVSVTGTTPGAGAEISETVPANVVWLLKALTFKLTAAIAVANRIPHLLLDDGVNVLLNSPAPTAIVASATGTYVVGDDSFTLAATDGVQWFQFVNGLLLWPGFRLRTLTTGIQGADQYTAPQYLVQEWIAT